MLWLIHRVIDISWCVELLFEQRTDQPVKMNLVEVTKRIFRDIASSLHILKLDARTYIDFCKREDVHPHIVRSKFETTQVYKQGSHKNIHFYIFHRY